MSSKRNTRYKLTWCKDGSKRWKKVYRGKPYYFPLEPGETKASSYGRCLAAWEEMKVDLDKTVSFPAGSPLAEFVQLVQHYQDSAERRDDVPRYAASSSLLNLLQQALLRGVEVQVDEEGRISLPPGHTAPEPSRNVSKSLDRLDEVTRDALDALSPLAGQDTSDRPWHAEREQQTDRTIGKQLLDFQATYPKVSNSRVNQYRSWCDVTADVSTINGAHCLAYQNYLESRTVGDDPISRSHAMTLLKTLKHFVRFLVEDVEVLERLPKNYKKLVIEVPKTAVKTFDVETIHRLLRGGRADGKLETERQIRGDERMRLWLLLMLNCGFYQKDCADLRHDQVDWEKGRITRKRSKLENSGGNVPVVTYQLWSETFSLLKKHRSNDPERVLVNQHGRVLVTQDKGRGRTDSVKQALNRYLDRLRITCLPMKHLRKTTSSLIANRFGEDVATLFLGDAPTSTAGVSYIAVDDDRLDQPLSYARRELKIGGVLDSEGNPKVSGYCSVR